MAKEPKSTAVLSPDVESKLKDLMGEEDYKVFVQFKQRQDDKKLRQSIKDEADKLLSEGGRYFEEYKKATERLDDIERKAMKEAEKALGVVSED